MTTLIVLGMHRSGTSAITRALNLLGASFGTEGSVGQYWEHNALREINDRVLAQVGGGWDGVPPLSDDWASGPRWKRLNRQARRTVRQEFSGDEVTVWKDPRTCLTLPFWRRAFRVPPIYVIIHRHPTESARSLAVRNDMGIGHAFAMWERHNADALRAVVTERAVVLSYERMVEDPRGTMVELADHLTAWDVELPYDPRTTEMELDESRRHHAASTDDLDRGATASQLALRELLVASEGGHDFFELPGPIPAPDPLSVELLTMAGTARYHRIRSRKIMDRLRRVRAEHGGDSETTGNGGTDEQLRDDELGNEELPDEELIDDELMDEDLMDEEQSGRDPSVGDPSGPWDCDEPGPSDETVVRQSGR